MPRINKMYLLLGDTTCYVAVDYQRRTVGGIKYVADT